MTRKLLITLTIILWLTIALLTVLAVRAESDCSGVVSPYGRLANVRPQPNTIASPVATLSIGNSLPSNAAVRGWYPLCGGNYISESVARYMTNTPRPTVSATAMPRATPTQIQHNLIWCSTEPEVRRVGQSWVVECAR
ncbi:MAG: hypothetical protein Q7T18_11855 [Sedimentisphaerales bacterium]|nr:hypothetical protein [Sedimentisphaerales bacterium]